MQLLIRLQLA